MLVAVMRLRNIMMFKTLNMHFLGVFYYAQAFKIKAICFKSIILI